MAKFPTRKVLFSSWQPPISQISRLC